jgi:hypothetical protein
VSKLAAVMQRRATPSRGLDWIPPGAKARNWRDSDLQRHMGGETK